MKIRLAAAFATAGLVAAPAAAHAATKSVAMGPPPKTARVLQDKYGADSRSFYPAKIAIRRGDKLRFIPYGFHNVSLPARGGKPAPLRRRAGKVTGAVDAAGAPFWFNGLDAFQVNPTLLKSNFGKTATYTRAKAIGSGLPITDRPKPFTVKFTRRGTHAYYCSIHNRMKGQVTVKSAKGSVPSTKADQKRVTRQLADDVKAAKGLLKTEAPANTVVLGSSAAGGVESYGVFPKQLTVPLWTAVEFRMKSTSHERHTATFGPGDPDREPKSYLGVLAASYDSRAPDPRAIYPSERPGTLAVHTAALHGNGFWTSGELDADKSTTRFPAVSRVRFGQTGSFTFYCLLHPFMNGTVIVR